MIKKRGKAALEQAANVMVAVSHSLIRKILLTFPGIMSLLIFFSLFNAGHYVVAWAHQDYLKPLNQVEQRAEKMRELHAQVIDLENKLETKEEELKSNEIELVAWTKKYEQVQAVVKLLKGELAQLHTDNRSLQTYLNKAKEEARLLLLR